MQIEVKSEKLQLLYDMSSPLANATADLSLLGQQVEDSCRICFEPSSKPNKLITPCRCYGSVRYVHEECLKLWLMSSSQDDLTKATCEICKTPYVMELKISWRFSCENLLVDKLMQLCFLPLLVMVFIILVMIIAVLGSQYLHDDTQDQEQKNCTLVIMVTCFSTMCVVVYLIASILKETCCLHTLAHWVIKSQNLSPLPNRKEAPDEASAPAMTAEFQLPAKVKVNGMTLPAPQIVNRNMEISQKSDGSVTVRPRGTSNTGQGGTSRTANYAHTISHIQADSQSASIR